MEFELPIASCAIYDGLSYGVIRYTLTATVPVPRGGLAMIITNKEHFRCCTRIPIPSTE